MSNEEVYNLLKKLNLPVAYNHFKDKVTPPFIIYDETSPNTFKADDLVYSQTNTYTIYLITDKKDYKLEKKVESLLNENHIPYEKDFDFIDTEQIFQTEYNI